MSCHAMMRLTSVSETFGKNTGMNNRLPSFSGGMNSLPIAMRQFGSEFGFLFSICEMIGRGTPNARTSAATNEIKANPKTVSETAMPSQNQDRKSATASASENYFSA